MCSHHVHTYGNLLSAVVLDFTLHYRERERRKKKWFAQCFHVPKSNPKRSCGSTIRKIFRWLQPRCSSILLSKLFSNSSITLKLQVMELNDESWEKTSHRQTDHRFKCMSYSYWIAQRVSSHNIILQLPCFPTVPSKLPRSLGVLVRTPGTCQKVASRRICCFLLRGVMFLADGSMWGDLPQ